MMVFYDSRMPQKQFLGNKEISFAQNAGADSEDGLDCDEDSLDDPDIVSELDTFEDEGAEEILMWIP